MKEINKKQAYLTPAVQVKFVAVENGFQLSTVGMTEAIEDGAIIDF